MDLQLRTLEALLQSTRQERDDLGRSLAAATGEVVNGNGNGHGHAFIYSFDPFV